MSIKTIPAALQTVLDAEAATLCTLWRIVRLDGTILTFTDLDADIDFEAETYYSAVSYSRSAIDKDVESKAQNSSIDGILDSSFITNEDLKAGLYDFAQMTVKMIDYSNVGNGSFILSVGQLGEVSMDSNRTFSAELRGLETKFDQVALKAYTKTCTLDLGGPKCGVPLDPDLRLDSTDYVVGDTIKVATAVGTGQETYENRYYECTIAGTTDVSVPSYDTTIGNITVDGTASFVAVDSWARHGEVISITNNRVFEVTVTESRNENYWFDYGSVKWDTGNNAGLVMDIKKWRFGLDIIKLFLPMPFEIQVGDKFRITPGCMKRFKGDCVNKFDNKDSNGVYKFRGFPYIPGPDFLARLPNVD